MKLAELQARFLSRVDGAPGAEDGPSEWLRPSRGASVEASLAIHARGQAVSDARPFAIAAPLARRMLGEAAFEAMVRAFLGRQPFRGRFHEELPRQVRDFCAFLREQDSGRPDLGDLAALEWARTRASEAAWVEPLPPEALEGMEEVRLAASRLRLAPGVALVACGHDVDALWRALESGEAGELPAPCPRETTFLVWRQREDVLHLALEPLEAEALRRVLARAPLSQVLALFPGGTEQALELLKTWCLDGLALALEAGADTA